MKTKHNNCAILTTAFQATARWTAPSLRRGVAAWALIVGLLASSAGTQAQTYTILHAFSGPTTDGADGGSLLITNSIIYGVSQFGGNNNAGTVYKIGTDGTGYTILHHFTGGSPFDSVYYHAGTIPNGLQLIGSTLYGLTMYGGSSSNGTLYSIGTDGSGYQVLHNFGGTLADGANPIGLQLSGTTLYGLTMAGIGSTSGTIFKFNTAGSVYQILHTFGSIENDGYGVGTFVVSGSTIYGATPEGGFNGQPFVYPTNLGSGTLYSLGTDGSNYQILHNFGSVTGDGTMPIAFELNGSTLTGVTPYGGSHQAGTVYKISTSGSGYQILYNFGATATDGIMPSYLLPIAGSTFYGSCASGGVNNAGILFKINQDGGSYAILHSFTEPAPVDPGLVDLSGSTLYGSTEFGGTSRSGSVFSVGTDGSNYQVLHNFPAGAGDGFTTIDWVRLIGSTLYGLTTTGNVNSGVIFKLAVSGGGTSTKIIGLSGNLAFGNVTNGTTATATLTLHNTGNTTLTVTSISYPTGFSGAWSGTIPAGSSHDVTVTFAPVAVVSYSGTVTVASDATSGTGTLAASGAGVAPVVATKIIGFTGSLAFGNATTGSTTTATLTIHNTGNTTLTVTSISYPTGFSGAWSGTIPAGSSHDVTVTFAPVAVVSYSGTVTVASDATSGTGTLAASGTGIASLQIATPTITPDSGAFTNSVKVTLSCTTVGATIRYTIDGTEPTSKSTLYKKTGITVTNTLTIQAKAFKAKLPDSAVAAATITIIPPPPLAITTTSLTDGKAKVAYGPVTLVATGGVAPYKWSLATGSKLPAGLSLKSTTGVISGKPSKMTATPASFTVKVTDAKKQPATQILTITITN